MTVISLIPPKRNALPRQGATNTRERPHPKAELARRQTLPVLSCTTRGFSCPAGCPPGGGLLPRLFTLTPTSEDAGAVCFL